MELPSYRVGMDRPSAERLPCGKVFAGARVFLVEDKDKGIELDGEDGCPRNLVHTNKVVQLQWGQRRDWSHSRRIFIFSTWGCAKRQKKIF